MGDEAAEVDVCGYQDGHEDTANMETLVSGK